MLKIVSGTMGAGKTYYGVRWSWLNRNNYGLCITNIRGLIKTHDFYDNRLDDLLKKVQYLYSKFMTDDNYKSSDELLIKELKDSNFLLFDKPTLLLIDEAHNIFNKKADPYLVWLITYSEHLKLDIIFITQNPSLISKEYYSVGDDFIHAVPSSRNSIFIWQKNKLKYLHYISYPYYGDSNRSYIEVIEKEDKYFQMYKSGDRPNIERKSPLTKFFKFIILGIVIFIFLLIFIFYNLFGSSDDTAHIEPKKVVKTRSVVTPKKVKMFPKDLFIYFFDGDYYQCNDLYIPKQLIKKSPVYIDSLGYGFSYVYFDTPIPFCVNKVKEKSNHGFKIF